MVQEKLLILKYLWSGTEWERFEIIIGDAIEIGSSIVICDQNNKLTFKSCSGWNTFSIKVRGYSRVEEYGGLTPFRKLPIPQLIEGYYYRLVYTGKLEIDPNTTVVIGIKDGEMKEFSCLQETFSARKFFIEEMKKAERKISQLESEVNYWKGNANNNSALMTRNSTELASAKDELKLVKIANITLQGKITDKDREIREKNDLIKVGERVLQTTQSQLTTSQNQVQQKENEIGRLEIRLDQRRDDMKILENQLSDLWVNDGKKDEKLRQKNEEIERLKNLAENHDKRADKSQEELLNEKIRSEKRSLELFANQELKIDMEQIYSLSKYHERLFIARKTHNQANIDVHEGNISRAKKELQERAKISVINLQEICQKCERIAEFNWELNQIQQQYEAHQEVPPYNNN